MTELVWDGKRKDGKKQGPTETAQKSIARRSFFWLERMATGLTVCQGKPVKRSDISVPATLSGLCASKGVLTGDVFRRTVSLSRNS